MTIDELLKEPDDFNLANGVFLLIGQPQDGRFDASEVTPFERPIVLVWHASGIIGNGGFEYLFAGPWKGDPHYRETVQAHRDLCLRKRTEAFERALAVFPNSLPPIDPAERHALYMAVPVGVREETNHLFWDERPEKQVAEYIRRNATSFAYLRGRVS